MVTQSANLVIIDSKAILYSIEGMFIVDTYLAHFKMKLKPCYANIDD